MLKKRCYDKSSFFFIQMKANLYVSYVLGARACPFDGARNDYNFFPLCFFFAIFRVDVLAQDHA